MRRFRFIWIAVAICCSVVVLWNWCETVFAPIIPLEEAIAYGNVPICGYIYRVSNREKRISAIMYERNEVKCKLNVVGKVNFYFDREGRVMKIDSGDCIYEMEYEPALNLPYRRIECRQSDTVDGLKWINILEYDKGWNSLFYSLLRSWTKKVTGTDGIRERWIKTGKDSVDITQYKYYRIKMGKMVSGVEDGKNRKKKGGMEYFYGRESISFQKIEDTLYTGSLDYDEVPVFYYDCDYWYKMKEGRVYMSYYRNRKSGWEYFCNLEKSWFPHSWAYCVARIEYNDIFYSNLLRVWNPVCDYMMIEYHVEEYWSE